MSNLRTRVLVAVVGIPLILATSLAGNAWFLLFVLLTSSIALGEFYRLVETKGAKPLAGLGITAGLFVGLSFYYGKLQLLLYELFEAFEASPPFPTQLQLLFIVLILASATICLVELFRNRGSPLLNVGTTLLGVLYVSMFFGTLVGLRELFVPLSFPMLKYFGTESSFMDPGLIQQVYTWGGYTVITLFACIWICDTAAYFAGMAVGKHRLFVRVSPNKTWEGAVAGFVAAVATALAAKHLALEYMSLTEAVVFGIIVGVFGQIGDLVESLFKRDAGVKDSSSIIPGHGGAFDRFDSLIFVSPLVYLYVDFVVFS